MGFPSGVYQKLQRVHTSRTRVSVEYTTAMAIMAMTAVLVGITTAEAERMKIVAFACLHSGSPGENIINSTANLYFQALYKGNYAKPIYTVEPV